MATLPADPIAQATEDLHRTIAESQLHRAKLSIGEVWWRDHQAWLQERGYMLRPRYRPGWVPSWEGKPDVDPFSCEDGIVQDVSDQYCSVFSAPFTDDALERCTPRCDAHFRWPDSQVEEDGRGMDEE